MGPPPRGSTRFRRGGPWLSSVPSWPRIAVWALAAAAAVSPACTKTSDLRFVVKLPVESKAGTRWIEVGAYATETCPTIGQLGGGLPQGSLIRRVAFAADGVPPGFTFERGTYAFAATARDTQCETLAAGCTAIEVPGTDEITIDLKPSVVRGGKCGVGAACLNAECVPSAGSESTGSGCTLEVVGAGPLEALSSGGSSVSRPVIEAVTDGFIIAYSQIDGDKYRVTTLKVGFDGGWFNATDQTTLPFNRYSIPTNVCPDDARTEGLCLKFDAPSANSGLTLVPRSPTCVDALFSIFQMQPDGHFAATSAPSPALGQPAQSLVMTNHCLASGGYTTYVLDKQAYLQTVTATGVGAGAPSLVGGPAPHARSWIAANRDALAVLVQAEGTAPAAPAADGGTVGAGAIDAPELRLQVALQDAARTFGEIGPHPRGRFGALALAGTRGVVLSSGSLDAPVQYSLFTVGDRTFSGTASVPVNETGRTLAADVALSGDRMFVASMLTNGVSVLAFDKFSGTPTLIKEKALARDFRVRQFMGGIFDELRDGYIAVAAEGSRVGVVWMTGERISAGEEVGGWAVLACR